MRKTLSLLLILLSFSLLIAIENSWEYNRLASPGRTDLLCSEGVMKKDELAILSYEAPGLLLAASARAEGTISDAGHPAAVLAVTPGYIELNPIRIVRGAFYLDNAVLIRKDIAAEIFGSDDVAGGNVCFNGEPHLIAGIFELPPLIERLSSNMPEVITSIDNPSVDVGPIQLIQIASDQPEDDALLDSYINGKESTEQKISSRYKLLRQLKRFLYIPLVLSIFISLVRILKIDFSSRKKLFKVSIRKYYLARTMKTVLQKEPLLYIVPVLLIGALFYLFGFTPYLPAEIIKILTTEGIIFWPLRFIMSITDDFNPAIILPGLYEAAAFVIVFLLYLPGFIEICRIKTFSLIDTLIIPVLNLLFTILFLFLGIEPVFDYKINLLLLLLITVSAVEAELAGKESLF